MGIEAASDDNHPMSQTVLIVYDHSGFRASARRVLESAGYTVVADAVDGDSGVAAAIDTPPDVVLLDVQLPDIDGFEVARRLAEAGVASAIVLTSSRDRSDFGSLIDASGVRGFLPKAELSAESLAAVL